MKQLKITQTSIRESVVLSIDETTYKGEATIESKVITLNERNKVYSIRTKDFIKAKARYIKELSDLIGCPIEYIREDVEGFRGILTRLIVNGKDAAFKSKKPWMIVRRGGVQYCSLKGYKSSSKAIING